MKRILKGLFFLFCFCLMFTAIWLVLREVLIYMDIPAQTRKTVNGVMFILLLLLGAGVAGRTILKGPGKKQIAGNRDIWLTANRWEQPIKHAYSKWEIYTNRPTREIAFFRLDQDCKMPERLVPFSKLAHIGLHQEQEKGGTVLWLVLYFVDPQLTPYIVIVNEKPLRENSAEYQKALAFAKQVEEQLSLIPQGRTSPNDGMRLVVAGCPKCGQRLRGAPGAKGWCPKCDTDIQLPVW